MREFNTCGPCDPSLHYTVIREALIAEGQAKVAKGRFFTFPRQAGKTTFFQQLLRKLIDSYTPIWISLENLKPLVQEGGNLRTTRATIKDCPYPLQLIL